MIWIFVIGVIGRTASPQCGLCMWERGGSSTAAEGQDFRGSHPKSAWGWVGPAEVSRAFPGWVVETEGAFASEDMPWRLGWVCACYLAEMVSRGLTRSERAGRCFSRVWHQSRRRLATGSSREEGAPGPEARVGSVGGGWVKLRWQACREGMVVWFGMRRRSWRSCADATAGDEGVVKAVA